MVPDTLIWGYSHQFVGIFILTVCMVKHHSYIPGSNQQQIAMTLNMRSPVVRSKCDAKVERLVPPPCTRTRPAWWTQSGSSPRKLFGPRICNFRPFQFCTKIFTKTSQKKHLLILIGSLFWQEWIHQTYITWLWFWLKNKFSELSTVLPITDHTTMMLLAAERSNLVRPFDPSDRCRSIRPHHAAHQKSCT